MIECTSAMDSVARHVFGKDNVVITNIKAMISKFALDPTVSKAKRDAFIVADIDITKRNKEEFLSAAAAKHPDVVIVFVARKGKTDIKVGNGIDIVLEKPKLEQIGNAVFGILESISKKGTIESGNNKPSAIEEFTPIPDFETAKVLDAFGNEKGYDVVQEEAGEYVEEKEISLPAIDLPDEVNEYRPVETRPESELLGRIKACDRVSDIAVITRELTAAEVVKDIVKSNADYTGIEERLSGIREKIKAIYLDPGITDNAERLDKVRSVLYDKNYYEAKTNTIVEQRVEEIINLVVVKTKECLDKRCAELDRAIANCNQQAARYDHTRLAGILDERSNVLLELQVLRKEVESVFKDVVDFAHDAVSRIAETSATRTDSPLLDARLALTGDSIVTEHTVDVLAKILETADRASKEFKEASRGLVILTNKMLKVIDLDNELIAVLTQAVEFLQANNVEDSIIKETLIKKSMRVFVAWEGSGSTVVPYVLSALKSRQNCNVLYIDITGRSKLGNYGENAVDIQDWITDRNEKDFCIVAGRLLNEPEQAQRFATALTKAADFYRAINIVMDPAQNVILDTLLPDVLSINYIVSPAGLNIDFFREFIKITVCDNVAQRVIINKSIDSANKQIIERLGLIDNLNVHVVTIPYDPCIVECGLSGIKPYELSSVKETFREASKVC